MKGAAAVKTLTVRVPMTFRKRGGRKLVIAPDGGTLAPPRRRIDNAMVKAIARALTNGWTKSFAIWVQRFMPVTRRLDHEAYDCRVHDWTVYSNVCFF